jgi:hypothetical protein
VAADKRSNVAFVAGQGRGPWSLLVVLGSSERWPDGGVALFVL